MRMWAKRSHKTGLYKLMAQMVVDIEGWDICKKLGEIGVSFEYKELEGMVHYTWKCMNFGSRLETREVFGRDVHLTDNLIKVRVSEKVVLKRGGKKICLKLKRWDIPTFDKGKILNGW